LISSEVFNYWDSIYILVTLKSQVLQPLRDILAGCGLHGVSLTQSVVLPCALVGPCTFLPRETPYWDAIFTSKLVGRFIEYSNDILNMLLNKMKKSECHRLFGGKPIFAWRFDVYNQSKMLDHVNRLWVARIRSIIWYDKANHASHCWEIGQRVFVGMSSIMDANFEAWVNLTFLRIKVIKKTQLNFSELFETKSTMLPTF
jgi:hypothetical protein